MTKTEFLKEMFRLAEELPKTDDTLTISMIVNDAEKLYDSHIKDVIDKSISNTADKLLTKYF